MRLRLALGQLLALGLACAVSATGCGDDDDPGPVDAGGRVDSSSGTDAGMDAGMDAGGEEDAGTPVNACLNDDDLMALTNTHGMDELTFDQIAQGCTGMCLGMPASCIVDCIVAATDNPMISENCALCSALFGQCNIRMCLAACPDPMNPSPECAACVCGNCAPDLEACSGLPFPACVPPPDGGMGDAGMGDAGMDDAGMADAGMDDAGADGGA